MMLLRDPPSHCYIMIQKEKPFGTLPPIIVLFCKHFSYMTTEEYGPVESASDIPFAFCLVIVRFKIQNIKMVSINKGVSY